MQRRLTITAILAAAILFGGSVEPAGVEAEPAAAARRATSVTVARGSIDYVRSIDLGSLREYTKPRSVWGKLLKWVAGPASHPYLLRPHGVTQDNRGRLIIADPGQGVVHIFDFEKRRYRHLRGPRRKPFLFPIGVATDAADNIYVSDSVRARIYVFNKKGKFRRLLGDPSSGTTFERPTGLAIDPDRKRIYLTDTLRHQVLVLNLSGVLLQAIGQRGTGPGEFNYPTALALANGNLFVVDAMNFRIQVLTPEGEFVRAFGQLGNRSGTLNRPKGIAVDTDGNIYVVDALFETVQVFNQEGRLLYYFGSTGAEPGEFVLPTGIYIDPRNHIFVADTYNRRVQEFRYRRQRP